MKKVSFSGAWGLLRLWLAAILLCIAQLACVPIPYVVPPIRAESQLAHPLAAGDALAQETERGAANQLHRVGVFPLGFVPSSLGRKFDVGAGVIFADSPLHIGWQEHDDVAQVEFLQADHLGGFVEGHYWFKVLKPENGTSAQRFGVVFDAQYFEPSSVGSHQEPGLGASLGIEFESAMLTTFAYQGQVEEGAFVGVAAGELGYAVSAKASYHDLGYVDYWSTGVSVAIRFPASAGVFFLPLDWLSK